MSHSIERYEERLLELYARIGTVDPSSAGFQALLEECALLAARIEREVHGLAKAPAEQRERVREQLERSAALNSLVQDAVRRERERVGEGLRRARCVREALARSQSDKSGDSCDVRG